METEAQPKMCSPGREVCHKCSGIVQPCHSFEPGNNLTQEIGCPRPAGTSDSNFSGMDAGLGGDGDSLKLPSLFSTNDSLWQNKDPNGFMDYLNHFTETTTTQQKIDRKSKKILPTLREAKVITSVFFIFVTACVVLTGLMLLWHTKEIAKLENSFNELQKQQHISDNQNILSIKLLQSQTKTIVDKLVSRKLRTLGHRDCEAIAGNCAWDICVGGFPSFLNKIIVFPWSAKKVEEIDTDFNTGYEPNDILSENDDITKTYDGIEINREEL